jgi:hypothetical protein
LSRYRGGLTKHQKGLWEERHDFSFMNLYKKEEEEKGYLLFLAKTDPLCPPYQRQMPSG